VFCLLPYHLRFLFVLKKLKRLRAGGNKSIRHTRSTNTSRFHVSASSRSLSPSRALNLFLVQIYLIPRPLRERKQIGRECLRCHFKEATNRDSTKLLLSKEVAIVFPLERHERSKKKKTDTIWDFGIKYFKLQKIQRLATSSQSERSTTSVLFVHYIITYK